MQIYNDFEGPQKVMRSATPVTANKRITNRDERLVIGDYSSKKNKSGAHSNSTRVPFGPSNRNVTNSADFSRNRSTTRLGFIPKDSNMPCSTPFPARYSRARPREKLQFSAERSNSVSQVDRSERVMERCRSSGWQESGGISSPMELGVSYDNVMKRSRSLGGNEGGGAVSSPWQQHPSDNMVMSFGNNSSTSLSKFSMKASPRLHEKLQISMHRSNSVCQSDLVTRSSRSLVRQQSVSTLFSQQLRASDSAIESTCYNSTSPRLRRLRSFITDQRRKRARAEAEESNTQHKGVREYETPPLPLSFCALDDVFVSNSQNKSTKRLIEVTKRRHRRRERSYCQKVLVGTDICVPKPHNPDTSIGLTGLISDNEDTTSMTSSETKSCTRSTDIKNRPSSRTPLPILYLGSFQQSIWLDFGDESSNIVGRSRSLQFQVRAPDSPLESSSSSLASSVSVEDYCFIVKVEDVPMKKGFALNFLDRFEEEKEEESADPTIFSIDAGESRRLTLTWNPVEPGDMREDMYLKLQDGRVRIIAHGNARDGNTYITKGQNEEQTQMQEKPTTIRKRALASDRAPARINISSSLEFDSCLKEDSMLENSARTSSCSSIISRYPKELTRTPFIYNDAWAEKQYNTYQRWLNFMYQGMDGIHGTNTILELDTVQPSERQAAGTLLLQRQQARTRQIAINLYRKPEMLDIRYAIQLEVKNKRLSFRPDPYVLANVLLRDRLVSLLLSYSAPWLRLGLETIFGIVITTKLLSKPLGPESETQRLSGMRRRGSKQTTIKALLKRFIVERVLSDPDVKTKYTQGKCMTPSGRFEVLYKDEMGRTALQRILLLVLFLDKAKAENIIHSSPLLFNKNAAAKSTQDFLGLLCSEYIHGIGNLSKHLARVGVLVSHTQGYIEEFNCSVSNMAVDLRDGVRLAKLAEILSGDKKLSILGKLRLPAVSRLQKVHNIKVVLSAYSNLSIPNVEFVQPKHIVDGNRPIVLEFLWSIISRFDLTTLLDTTKLKLEIDTVHRTGMSKSSQYKKSCLHESLNDKQNGSEEQMDELRVLLLHWCRAVCWHYGVEVTDFSESFSDGKAICCLINFYRPSMLRRDEILPTVADTYYCGIDLETVKKDPHLRLQFRKILENERHNSALANRTMKEIGGIPHVLPISDSVATLDERSTIISIAHLCSRLLNSSKKILSATIIQRAFQSFRSKIFLEQRRMAAMLIMRCWSKYKLPQLEKRLDDYIQYTSNYAITIQRVWRGFMYKRRTYLNTEEKQSAATLIIRSWSKYKLVQLEHRLSDYIRFTRNQTITIQKVWRGIMYRRQCRFVQLNHNAATVIKRSWLKYRMAKLTKSAALMSIQEWSHRHGGMICFLEKVRKHKAARRIQAYYRGWMLKGYHRFATNQIVIIQKNWRSLLCRRYYHSFMRSVVLIQKTARRKFASTVLSNRKDAIIRIQCAARCNFAVRKLILMWTEMDYSHRRNLAATTIQAYVRRRIATKYLRDIIHISRHVNGSHCLRTEKRTKQTQSFNNGNEIQILRVRKMDCRVSQKLGNNHEDSTRRKRLRLSLSIL